MKLLRNYSNIVYALLDCYAYMYMYMYMYMSFSKDNFFFFKKKDVI